MLKMYKGDSEITVDKDQVALMKNSGWSSVKEEPKPVEEEPKPVEEEAPAEAEAETPTKTKSAPRRRAPKKKTE